MVPWLRSDDDPLPDTALALPADSPAPGLLAAGGTLGTARLRGAYARGIFPWYGEGQPLLWWAPDPRMVLYTAEFRLTRSLRKTIARFVRTPDCAVRVDSAFDAVIAACANTPRDGQDGTWIVPQMQQAYAAWHRAGDVHSVETWIDGQLVGGLYGVALGRMFFGESMFSHRNDASKIALAALVCICREHGIDLIDCQQHTAHLQSLGARPIDRPVFERHLAERVGVQAAVDWNYDPRLWRHLLAGPDAGAAPALDHP